MGIIEDRLAELQAMEQPRVEHQWHPTRGFGSGSGGYECRLCGGWMSALRNPDLHLAGCPGGKEAWRLLKPGDRVRVVHPISEVERALLGNEYVIERFSKPHNFAVCPAKDGGLALMLHPEALEKTPGT